MTPSAWTDLVERLALGLAALPTDGFVSLAPVDEGPGSGPVPVIQALRMPDALYLECVGSLSFGGSYPWTPEQETHLLGLGWRQQTTEEVFGDPQFVVHLACSTKALQLDDARWAAVLLCQTLAEVAGVPGPEALDVTTSEGPL